MKPFFVHHVRQQRRTDNSVKRHLPKGFTAFVSPVNDVNVPNRERLVQFAVTFCSNKDEFSKKMGREEVMGLIPDVINKRDLPRHLSEAHAHVENDWSHGTDYNYILKYVV